MAQLDAPSDWRPGGRGFNPALYWVQQNIIRPRWLSWMRRPTGDQEVAGLTPPYTGYNKTLYGLGGSVGCAVRLETRGSRVQPRLILGTTKHYTASVAQLDAPSDWRPRGRGFNPALYWVQQNIIRPRWFSWMRRPTGDQEVAGLTPAEVGNILSWRLIMKYFLRSFSPFR